MLNTIFYARVFYVVVFNCFLLPIAYSQPETMLLDWRNEKLPDTIRLQALDSLINDVFWTKQADSALLYIQLQKEIAVKKLLPDWETRALFNKVNLYYRNGDYLLAIPAVETLIERYESLGNREKGLAQAHHRLAYSLRKVGQLKPALHHYERSLEYGERLGDQGRAQRASTLNSMGSMYLNRNNYELAEEKYLASLELHLAIDKKIGVSSNYNNLSNLYYQLKDYDKALNYLPRALALKQEANDFKGIANIYGVYGDIYLDLGQLAKARAYYIKSLQLRQELQLQDDIAASFIQLGQIELLENNPQAALRWCQQGCDIAKELLLWENKTKCYDCLFQTYKIQGDFEQALIHHEALKQMNDSLFNVETTQEIALLEASYQYENQLAKAEATQIALENQAIQQQWWRRIMIGTIVMLALFFLLAWRVGLLRKRKNEELELKNEQINKDRKLISAQAAELEELAVAKNRFFTNISHELRTPLTLIISPLEKFLNNKTTKLSQTARNSLLLVQRNARKLMSLAEELLELSRLETNTAQVQQHTLQLRPFLQQVFGNFSVSATDANLDCQFLYQSDPQLMIESDPQRLERIIDNLLSNALKFTPAGGNVTMIAETTFDTATIGTLTVKVVDTGIGIAEKDLPRIFERYFQANALSNTGQNGNGIGLALAQESARLMQGEIIAERNQHLGTTFILKLPINRVEEVSSAAILIKEKPKDAITTKDRRILIVEDNKELSVFLHEVLADYSCSLAMNGKDAILQLQQAQNQGAAFHLVITDLMMPEMDGVELIKYLKSNDDFTALRSIVLTAKHELADKLQMLRIGVDDYLTKPFSVEELVARVENLLRFQTDEVSLNIDENLNSSANQLWLKQLEENIHQLISEQKDISANIVANVMNTSTRQLLRKIKLITGLSTQQYIQESKLHLARRYLEQKRFYTMAEVAHACGFKTPSYFSRVYLQRFGKRPSNYWSDDSQPSDQVLES